MQLDSDFSEFVASFAAHDVRFMIVGGYALAAHGLPRATGDLDAWIWTDPDNARRILGSLAEFGFGGLNITEADLTSDDCVIQLGSPRTGSTSSRESPGWSSRTRGLGG